MAFWGCVPSRPSRSPHPKLCGQCQQLWTLGASRTWGGPASSLPFHLRHLNPACPPAHTARTWRGKRDAPLASSGWYDAHTHRLYVYYSINKVVGSGAFGFKVEGYGLACASPPDRSLQFTRLHIKSQSSLWWPLDSGAAFGCAVIDDNADPYLYIVGVEDRQGHHYGKLARVLKSRIADLQAYEYFAGYGESPQTPRWSKHVQDAADVEGLKDFPNELSITYNTYLGAYLAVYSEGVFSQRALLCEASKPWGPYRPIGEISTPHRAFENAFCYACKEHPELTEQNGRIIYITYVDSERYWPQLLRVTLQKQTNTP